MPQDELDLAQQFAAAQEALAVELLAAGALPPSRADRLDVDIPIGGIVRDRVTGLYAEVLNIGIATVVHPRPRT